MLPIQDHDEPSYQNKFLSFKACLVSFYVISILMKSNHFMSAEAVPTMLKIDSLGILNAECLVPKYRRLMVEVWNKSEQLTAQSRRLG